MTFDDILNEMEDMGVCTTTEEYREFVEELASRLHETSSVIGLGAGRMGYALRAFMMRLSHMGYKSWMIGDTGLPRIHPYDVIIVNSSSGETPSIIEFVKQARAAGGIIFAVTTGKDSTIAKLSDYVLTYPKIKSFQPMKTACEQFTFALFDYIVLDLIKLCDIDVAFMTDNHSILE